MSPGYYAQSEEPITFDFEVEGQNFLYLPEDAIAVVSDLNNNPLVRKDTTNDSYILRIVEKTNTTMRLKSNSSAPHGSSFYLGAIISEDRTVVYWENTTQPLPQ